MRLRWSEGRPERVVSCLNDLQEASRKRIAAMNPNSDRMYRRQQWVTYAETAKEIAHVLCLSPRRDGLAGILCCAKKSRREWIIIGVAAAALLACSCIALSPEKALSN